jgi:hypothetical protein
MPGTYEEAGMSTVQRSATAVGFTVFAAAMLMIIGVFQAIAGLAAIAKDDASVYARTDDASYYLSLDTTQWGWIHLVIGIVVFCAGLGVLSGQVWARTVGVIVAGASAIVNFAFIPIYPVWSIVIIAVDVIVIWALTVHGRDIAAEEM